MLPAKCKWLHFSWATLYYGIVPDAFGVGIAIPLVKKMDGDRTKSDNYRCISPVISKIFEMVLMQIFSSQLQSDHLQLWF